MTLIPMINRAKIHVCSPSSFGGIKVHVRTDVYITAIGRLILKLCFCAYKFCGIIHIVCVFALLRL